MMKADVRTMSEGSEQIVMCKDEVVRLALKNFLFNNITIMVALEAAKIKPREVVETYEKLYDEHKKEIYAFVDRLVDSLPGTECRNSADGPGNGNDNSSDGSDG